MEKLQENLSSITPDLLDEVHKLPKVKKMLSVLLSEELIPNYSGVTLDVGCSGGFFCEGLAPYFKSVVGIDIDKKAIDFAKEQNSFDNILYELIGDDNLPQCDASVDLIICNHVYEHVPSAKKLFLEMYRVLKPEGAIYFGAASRLTVVEPHFKLPFLSWLPKFLAHKYMRIFGRGEFYYENLRTIYGLRALMVDFHVVDYTLDVIKNPRKFNANDMIKEGGLVSRLPRWLLKAVYPCLPSYIFILKK